MFDDNELEELSGIMNQVAQVAKVAIGGIDQLLKDDNFKDGFKSLMANAAEYANIMVVAYEGAGFSREEAVALTAATLQKSAGK
jgi:hypothetical protein